MARKARPYNSRVERSRHQRPRMEEYVDDEVVSIREPPSRTPNRTTPVSADNKEPNILLLTEFCSFCSCKLDIINTRSRFRATGFPFKVARKMSAKANILIDDDLHVRLSDFGLATLSDAYHSSTSSNVGSATRWSAPELLKGARSTTESDIYAFGSVCYEVHDLTSINLVHID